MVVNNFCDINFRNVKGSPIQKYKSLSALLMMLASIKVRAMRSNSFQYFANPSRWLRVADEYSRVSFSRSASVLVVVVCGPVPLEGWEDCIVVNNWAVGIVFGQPTHTQTILRHRQISVSLDDNSSHRNRFSIHQKTRTKHLDLVKTFQNQATAKSPLFSDTSYKTPSPFPSIFSEALHKIALHRPKVAFLATRISFPSSSKVVEHQAHLVYACAVGIHHLHENDHANLEACVITIVKMGREVCNGW